MPAPKPYQGHRSWNAWNVSLWLNNDEHTYRLCCETLRQHGGNVERAARMLRRRLPAKTPDGAPYNQRCVVETLKDYEVTL